MAGAEGLMLIGVLFLLGFIGFVLPLLARWLRDKSLCMLEREAALGNPVAIDYLAAMKGIERGLNEYEDVIQLMLIRKTMRDCIYYGRC